MRDLFGHRDALQPLLELLALRMLVEGATTGGGGATDGSGTACALGAIVRGARNGESEVIIAHHDTMIHAEDHVIVFVTNKRIIPKVEKLFQVGVGFF